MNTNRQVTSFRTYDEARVEKDKIYTYIIQNKLEKKRKVKIKPRNSGMFDVISYDINSVEE